MDINAAVFALLAGVAGYQRLRLSHHLKYETVRLGGQHLIIQSLYEGIKFYIPAYIIAAVGWNEFLRGPAAPSGDGFPGRALAVFERAPAAEMAGLLLAFCGVWIFARWQNRSPKSETQAKLDDFEARGLLLERQLYLAAEQKQLMMVEMENGKVYVGVIAQIRHTPQDDPKQQSFTLWLAMSGARDADKQFVAINYYGNFVDEQNEASAVALRTNKVESLQKYNAEAHKTSDAQTRGRQAPPR